MASPPAPSVRAVSPRDIVMPRSSSPTVRAIRVRAVLVPMAEPHRTAGDVVAASPLVLIDVDTDAGVTGHSMEFIYTPAALKLTADLTDSCGRYS